MNVLHILALAVLVAAIILFIVVAACTGEARVGLLVALWLAEDRRFRRVLLVAIFVAGAAEAVYGGLHRLQVRVDDLDHLEAQAAERVRHVAAVVRGVCERRNARLRAIGAIADDHPKRAKKLSERARKYAAKVLCQKHAGVCSNSIRPFDKFKPQVDRIGPGDIDRQRIPRSANSRATPIVIVFTAPLADA